MVAHADAVGENIGACFGKLRGFLDERQRRLYAGAQAATLGHGGVKLVAVATGLAINTVRAGLAELNSGAKIKGPPARVRVKGAGRKKATQSFPGLLECLEELVDPHTRGDPMNPLRWTCKSTTKLAAELQAQGFKVSQRTVCDMLHEAHYSLQSMRKTREGAQHPDRNAQFEHIAREVREYQRQGQPVISIDTKKKELVGDFANKGQEWQPKGEPEEARVHDFVDEKLGKVAPYGVYDLSRNEGWVSVGIDHDTAAFAAESIRRWWLEMGRSVYPQATQLLITADCGGSNSNRTRLWKVQLQRLADELGLRIAVCHFPPGTSKWNKIEHRMFCHITKNWRGRPLLSREVVVELIGHTTTKAGLKVRSALDEGAYPKGVKVSDEELQKVCLEPAEFHGEWNYFIAPKPRNMAQNAEGKISNKNF